MTTDFHLADRATADHEDPSNDGGVFRESVIAFLGWQFDGDPTGASWFGGEGWALCTDLVWSLGIK